MDYVIDFLDVGDGDAIVIWARSETCSDVVFFLDGGSSGNGQKVVNHYKEWIEPNLKANSLLGFINSHPHADHINGLLEIIKLLKNQLKFGIYNDPVECITEEHRQKIYQSYLKNEDADITHLYKTFEEIDELNNLCTQYNIRRYNAYSEDINFFDGSFKILSPSKDFYANLVQYFSDVDFLKTVDYSRKTIPRITEDEDLKPCTIVDAVNEASPENLTGTVIQLIDSSNRKYILTSDAGVDSFDYMESEGFELTNIRMVQLPHHGSRRNVNSSWLAKFNPEYYIASAAGNAKHPRRAVVNCIKRNLPNCKVYSTHLGGGTLSCTTNRAVFPNRNWGSATPL